MKPKQRAFCLHYSQSFNATEAAIMAGYSPKTARQQGSRLLTNVDVQKELKIIAERTRSKYQLSKEGFINALISILDSSPLNVFQVSKDGSIEFIPNGNLDSVESLNVIESNNKKSFKCTFTSKVDAICLLALLCGFIPSLPETVSKYKIQDLIQRLKSL